MNSIAFQRLAVRSGWKSPGKSLDGVDSNETKLSAAKMETHWLDTAVLQVVETPCVVLCPLLSDVHHTQQVK